MGPVGIWLEANSRDPTFHKSNVLACGEVSARDQSAREQPAIRISTPDCQPFGHRATGLLRNLELHGPAGLLLHNNRRRMAPAASTSVVRSETTSQPRSLLSIAMLNRAKSR